MKRIGEYMAVSDNKIRAYVFFLSCLLVMTGISKADWITDAYFSEDAGIDSINRFLVIQDIDSNIIWGEQIIPLGDISGDGINDIIICRLEGSMLDTNRAYLFYGGNPPDDTFEREYFNFQPTMGNIGDITGDGYDDIAMTRLPTQNIEIHFGGPSIDDSADFVIPNMWSYIEPAIDIDNDGILDLALSKSVNGGYVKIYQISENRDTIPEYIIPDTSKNFGDDIATGDFNGDGYDDLAVSAARNRDSCFVKFYWGGPDFDTIPDFEIFSYDHDFGRNIFSAEDFNGDGYEDIAILGGANVPDGIYFGGPLLDSGLDIIVNRHAGGYVTPTSADVAGDINNDGYPDFIVGISNFLAFIHEISIFLGGPDADSDRDIYMENLMVPGPQIDFGGRVVGIGDFNGDGIDDFAARSRTNRAAPWFLGEVNLFAGWDSRITEAESEESPRIPQKLELKQNYPNPFNPETTIEFSLPRGGFAELKIYNLMGEIIAIPIQQNLQAGVHQIQWNGLDQNGKATATGIYFYCIKSGNYTETKKMVLLK